VNRVRRQLEAIPGLREDFSKKGQGGEGRLEGEGGSERRGRGRLREARETRRGEGCWHGRWQLPRPDGLDGWDGPPSRDGVGGRSVVCCPVSKVVCAFL